MSLKRFQVKRQTDSYSWSESEDFVSISCNAKGMAMKHIDVFISDLFVKINITKINYFIVWDLLKPIQVGHPNNRVTLANGNIDIKLMKEEPGTMWSNLEYQGKKANKLKRRNESIKRFEEWEKKKHEAQGETKLKLDKAALDKQMELEQWERQVLKEKKEQEKKVIEDQLYDDLEQMEGLNQKLKQGYDVKHVQEEAERISKESINKLDPSLKNGSKVEEIKEDKKTYHFDDPSKNIFDESD